MCRSKSQGGQRCYSHAKKAFDRAYAHYIDLASSDPSSPRSFEAKDKVSRLGALLASTTDGERDLRVASAAATNIDRIDHAVWLDAMVKRGLVLRDCNNDLRKAFAKGNVVAVSKVRAEAGRRRRSDIAEDVARMVPADMAGKVAAAVRAGTYVP